MFCPEHGGSRAEPDSGRSKGGEAAKGLESVLGWEQSRALSSAPGQLRTWNVTALENGTSAVLSSRNVLGSGQEPPGFGESGSSPMSLEFACGLRCHCGTAATVSGWCLGLGVPLPPISSECFPPFIPFPLISPNLFPAAGRKWDFLVNTKINTAVSSTGGRGKRESQGLGWTRSTGLYIPESWRCCRMGKS